jgi:DNA-directed RNA polymerase subunit RPC12/RpoP
MPRIASKSKALSAHVKQGDPLGECARCGFAFADRNQKVHETTGGLWCETCSSEVIANVRAKGPLREY